MEKSHNSAVPSALWIILAPADCFCLRSYCFGSVSPVFIEKLQEAIVASAAMTDRHSERPAGERSGVIAA